MTGSHIKHIVKTIQSTSKMYTKSLTNLLEVPKLKEFLGGFDTVLTDCDGVLWLENNVIADSHNVLNKFREMGKQVFFVTNNSTKFKDDFIKKAKNLGFICAEHEMLSTSCLVARHLKLKEVKKAYIIGSQGLVKALADVGIDSEGAGPDVLQGSLGDYVRSFKIDPNVGAVVVGFDEHISYLKFLKAASYLANKNCLYIATNTDENFPASGTLVLPGTGASVSAVTTCSGRQPTVLGKPNPAMVADIIRDYNIEPKRTLMIGDRCNTDILLGHNCGFQTLLVLSGVTRLEDAEEFKDSGKLELVADVYLPKLGDLLPYL